MLSFSWLEKNPDLLNKRRGKNLQRAQLFLPFIMSKGIFTLKPPPPTPRQTASDRVERRTYFFSPAYGKPKKNLKMAGLLKAVEKNCPNPFQVFLTKKS